MQAKMDLHDLVGGIAGELASLILRHAQKAHDAFAELEAKRGELKVAEAA